MNRNVIVATVAAGALVCSACGRGGITAPTDAASPARAGDPAPDNVTGNYTLRITADQACTSLPEPARARAYSTTISGARSQLLTLSGSIFAPSQGSYPGTDWNIVAMSLAGDVATLWFSDPPIWEGMGRDTSVLIEGRAEGIFTSPVSELAMLGTIQFCGSRDDSYRCLVPTLSCTSTNHRITLARQ